MIRWSIPAASTLLGVLLRAAPAEPPAISADEILAKVEEANQRRQSLQSGYSAIRQYAVENVRFGVKAAMTVEAVADAAGSKQFRILRQSGPAAIRKLVFQRMLDTEAKASTKAVQASTRISRENYTFSYVGETAADGRKQFILDAVPKTANALLFRGRIWVDAEDFAVAKIEGSPAQNPSFWVRKTHFVHEYMELGGQWLARSNRSESDIRIFGHSVVTIRYGDYSFPGSPADGASRER